MRTEKIIVNSQEYLIKLHFEDRESARASISKKAINIRIPRGLNREELFRQMLEMKKWAIKKLQENPEKFKKQPVKEYKTGDMIKINNDEFLLHIIYSDKQSSSARFDGNNIFMNIVSNISEENKKKHISTLLSRVVARKRLPMLHEKINALNDKNFQLPLRKIFFKYNKSNWGSCSAAGNINISTRLLFAPDDVLEYICIHELSHLKEQNHSEKFWQLVENAMPNYREKELWLKDNSDKCVF